MYIPEYFRNSNFHQQVDFIKENSFGILITHSETGMFATHIPLTPLVINNNLVLHGHISKENPQSSTLSDGNDALVIFSGPHCYISSSWYSHENVSTWNYQAVHCHGKIKIQSEIELLQSLIQLTDHYESKEEKPKLFENIDTKVIRDNLSGIIGFAIVVSRIDAQDKLSQNRNKKDYENIVTHLQKRDDAMSGAIANAMLKNKDNTAG
ncbi:MAG TPA: FMN-binding negative transcriptional regulator [Bacteroidia bacterium]|jgi:transcriptional regulator|nr:FMN-binding negative transcriptional regulator [Bacteroidia bacterium]HMU18330.1 FMN-binding negative transcriptional regulator [Bacteroidia bacterium]